MVAARFLPGASSSSERQRVDRKSRAHLLGQGPEFAPSAVVRVRDLAPGQKGSGDEDGYEQQKPRRQPEARQRHVMVVAALSGLRKTGAPRLLLRWVRGFAYRVRLCFPSPQ